MGTGLPIVNRKIRFALVGCGRISSRHFQALKDNESQAELVAVCDNDSRVLEALKVDASVKKFLSLEALLTEAKIDIVVLATPSGLHAEQAIQCAKAGVHVMTEKPMATRWKDGQRMVQAFDAAGLKLFVVKQNRHNATLQVLKAAVDEGRFGKIYMVNINVFWTRPQEYYDSAAWRGTWEFDGGALMNQASHYIDLLDWLVGPIESVQAYTATLARDIEVEDTAVVNLRWRSGALGTANVTMLAFNKNFEGSITILGEKGTVRLGGVAINQFEHWEFEDSRPEDAKIRQTNYETGSVYGFGHSLYYKNVVAVLQGQSNPLTDGREGLRSLEVLIASYLSARDGRRVALPLEH